MSQTEYIPFIEWLPDRQSTNNRGLEVAKNCLATIDGFRGYPSFVQQSTNAINGVAKGLVSGEDGNGTSFTFVGDETKLYRYKSDNSFEDVSKAGDYTTVDFWDFALFEDRVIATGYNDAIQSYVLGTSTDFADLSASAPQARYVTTVRDFVLAANTIDSGDGAVPYRVWNSARADPTDWVVSAQTQAGFRDIYDSGPVTQAVGGSFGTVFTTGGVHRFTFVGPPRTWQVDEIGNGIGCVIPGSVVKRIESKGELAYIYFRSADAFCVTDGSTVREIGNERVNQWFADNFDGTKADQVTSGVFGIKDCVVWSFPSTRATGLNDSYIAFNYSSNKWAYGEIDVTQLGNTRTSATLLDEISDKVDDVTTPVDSSIWAGGDNVFGAIDHNGFLGTFVGPNLSPEFVTGDYRMGAGRTRVGRIWPDIDGTITTAVSYGETPRQLGAFSAESSLRRGFTSHRGLTITNNLFAIRAKSDSAFTEAKGMTVELYKANV